MDFFVIYKKLLYSVSQNCSTFLHKGKFFCEKENIRKDSYMKKKLRNFGTLCKSSKKPTYLQ